MKSSLSLAPANSEALKTDEGGKNDANCMLTQVRVTFGRLQSEWASSQIFRSIKLRICVKLLCGNMTGFQLNRL